MVDVIWNGGEDEDTQNLGIKMSTKKSGVMLICRSGKDIHPGDIVVSG